MPVCLQSLSTNPQTYLQLFHIFVICTSLFKFSVFVIYLLSINVLLCDDCLVLAHFSIVLCVCVFSLLICEFIIFYRYQFLFSYTSCKIFSVLSLSVLLLSLSCLLKNQNLVIPYSEFIKIVSYMLFSKSCIYFAFHF